ncbi:MAG: PIN domain-containing protein [Planctomycetes bacterium]|nr:PIN domain-containing protein [Planctomycetota bacterium]
MPLFVLDTDHVTLLQRGDKQVVARVQGASGDEIAASIVTYEEQLRGRLAVVHKATTPERLSVAYLRLREMHRFFCSLRLLDFDARAAAIYATLRRGHRALGSLDLRIAATVLAAGGTLVTRNRQDFTKIPGLQVVDWSRA